MISSYNGLSSVRRRAIIYIDDDSLGPLAKFDWKIFRLSQIIMHFPMPSAKIRLLSSLVPFIWHEQQRWAISLEALGPASIVNKKFYGKISRSFEAVGLVISIIASLWKFTGTSDALLPNYRSNSWAIAQFWMQNSRLQVVFKSYSKTSCRILKQGSDTIVSALQ